jgi:hypothetical protein
MMSYLSLTLYITGTLSMAVMLILFRTMGKRMGQALELPPYYRLYYISIFLFVIPLPVTWLLLATKAWGLPDPSPETALILKIVVASLPLAIGVTFALYATAKYWGWIWQELRGPESQNRRKGEPN